MRSYRLIGKTVRNQIADRVLHAVMAWQKEWCIDIGLAKVTVENFIDNQSYRHGFGIKRAGDYSLFCLDSTVDFGKIIFGETLGLSKGDIIAARTINDAKIGLMNTIAENFGFEYEGEFTSEEFTYKPLSGIKDVCAFVELNGALIEIFVANFLVEKCIPVSPKHDERKLEKRSDVCQSAKVSVDVELKLGSFKIALLQSLAVGDVLLTDVKLNAPMQLKINNTTFMPVHLGKKEDSKAILFLSKSK